MLAAGQLFVGVEDIQHPRTVARIERRGGGIGPARRFHRAIQQRRLDGPDVRCCIGVAAAIAAKSGLIGFTKAIALELAPEVTVNCVSPGRIEDEDDAAEELTKRAGRPTAAQIPLQRMGRTGDVAATVKFLCSDEASYITGQVIHVNGGAYMG